MICEHREDDSNCAPEWLFYSRPKPKPRTRDVILVIDGDSLSRAITGRYLENLGWKAMFAADGAAGLAMFRASSDLIAAVVLEFHLPGNDGARVLRELRRIRADLPVVICASHAPEQISRCLQEVSIADCLLKPFSSGQLELAMRMAGRVRRAAAKWDA